jgi:hypothetical protein
MRPPLTSRTEDFDGQTPLLFRAADMLRLEGVVAAVTQDGMSLALVSRHEAILDHYGKILVERLRAVAPEIGIEIYFPASADALLARFNSALGDYTVQQAMEASVPIAPPKIWVVHDASALPDHEIQLLARLVQHFPGANIRVVMLLPQGSKKQKLLISFGRRILNWEIDPPTPEQADIMLTQAQIQGREGAVRALLQKIAVPLAPPARPARYADPEDPPLFAPASAAAAASAPEPVAAPAPAPATPAVPAPAASAAAKVGRRWVSWLIGVAVLLLLSAATVAVLHREAVVQWLGGSGSAEAVPAPAAAPVAAPPASPALAPAPVAGVDLSAAANAPAPVGVAAAPPPLLAAPPAAPAPAPTPAPVSEEVVIAPAEIRAGQSWVQQMPAGTFLVQHVIVPSYTEAKQWMQAHTNLKRARLVAFYLPNDSNTQYCVVSGPFESMAQAVAYGQNPNVPRGSQIRSARYMKEQFTPESADAYALKRQESKR